MDEHIRTAIAAYEPKRGECEEMGPEQEKRRSCYDQS